MILALLIAGIVAVVAGLLAVLFGYTVRDFSLGSTLIISGTIGVCSGMLLVGLHVVALELKGIACRLAGSTAPSDVRVRPVLPSGLAMPGPGATEPTPAAAMQVEPPPPSTAAPPPWQSEAAARERPRGEVPAEPEAPPPVAEVPRRRNLLFASTSRKERERAQAKGMDGLPPQLPEESGEPAAPEVPPASFDDAWPKQDRARPSEPAVARRPPPRTPSTFEPAPPQPEPELPPAEQPQVTVLKSGVVDGMAYSLYSDGSIEAQMPEGMMRFASIDELRAHLDQRS
ncbi:MULTISPECIES: DUF308 domain-containing protein [unclassified Bradyrhizobium]|uniref:DUF308 domain-containing protein n=1 Tax=unclassified Bradyrhizobium TaxID=2631580 RepID=UPI001FF7EE88|nr:MULTISPECIES: DUF308 domain-containing protein [unclassified Bradyrhizobium]MCK1708121.1 DUF308 domain-containing protein [Bradyrhizobium sp. 143]MCK1726805.1 DUF308 domain-containing protein [Bradyrhizobium sp. 142]